MDPKISQEAQEGLYPGPARAACARKAGIQQGTELLQDCVFEYLCLIVPIEYSIAVLIISTLAARMGSPYRETRKEPSVVRKAPVKDSLNTIEA